MQCVTVSLTNVKVRKCIHKLYKTEKLTSYKINMSGNVAESDLGNGSNTQMLYFNRYHFNTNVTFANVTCRYTVLLLLLKGSPLQYSVTTDTLLVSLSCLIIH